MEIGAYSTKYIHYYTGEIPWMVSLVFKSFAVENFADLGSGDGALLYSLLASGYLAKASNVIAVDISRERINNVSRIDTKIKCFQADVCNLKMINDESMDFVVSSQVIEHIPDQGKFISEAHRILRKNGIFYLSTVFKKWYAWYFYRSNGRWVLDPTHVREYQDTCELLGIVRRRGFEVLQDKKTLQWFPVTDFFLKRICPKNDDARRAYKNRLLSAARKFKVPVPGYYNWEMLLKKN